ncbi:hypothetical protein N0M98_20995 [Paenibacillus doosanensis]|uniref:exo-rhamnogalacturonan lyase family protein n=1 Tax=Paenibacillus doosanensis TaxID=1229154 RepID=UPI0021806AD2|nr:hypothetical protein [Paenibacillus doosanensis]MCS7462602.1 hypothetical protein [Paenibacillus doosanensis]
MSVQTDRIELKWLGTKGHAADGLGVTWGIPWAEGQLQRDEPLALTGAGGEAVPVQSWPTAYWPDGSVKWSAHAASIAGERSDAYYLSKGAPAAAAGVKVTSSDDEVVVDTGSIVCRLNREGSSLIRSIQRGGSLVCTGGRLLCIREERHATSGVVTRKEHPFSSVISSVAVEQSGPVRAVVRIEGNHKLHAGVREWLPFSLRLYFYAGQPTIKAIHTFKFDGNPHMDFIKGLGMTFKVPMNGPLYNRHVRFAGDAGIFAESPKHLMTIRTSGKYEELFRRQTAGEPVSFDPEEDERFIGLIEESAVWDDFKLVQSSADSYTITKRTQEGCAWIRAAFGQRSLGTAYAGGENGGLSVGVRNFWKKYPSSLELHHTSKEEAELTAWFWSPDAEPMDLRHYDTTTHLQSSYEGFDEMRSTPYGIANTSELALGCYERTPSHAELHAAALECQSPSLLVCRPEHYYEARAFGIWSLPNRSTSAHARLEDQLDAAIEFYKEEIEQRRWYGFWDYGDVMHSYDPTRHTWRYDIGGCAWQNTELVPNMWLWYMFLRSGREDIFRLAEAMTRHTSEVDVYHFGEYAGLGSRHNVVHWGCGCKEARIGMAGLHRFYYYLTADERIGDIMNEVTDSDYTTVHLDPMRYYFPKDEYPTHARVGPDWAAFSSNWMTRWERYEDTSYRDKLLVGIESLKRMPNRMKNLAVHGYDPKTGKLYDMGNNAGGHLAICMGGPQVWMELAFMLKDPEWETMLAEIGEFYNLPREVKEEKLVGELGKGGYSWPMFSTGIAAYAASRNQDAALAQLAWSILLNDEVGNVHLGHSAQAVDELGYIRPIREIPWIATNTVSQWSLNAIVCLELIGPSLAQAEAAAGSD